MSGGLRADARRNREAVLTAAAQAFAEEGVGVPVDEIARRAGVGAGTLYRHFPTKEDLFGAVLVAHMESLVARARQLAEGDDPGVALFDFITCLAREAAAKKSLVDALSGSGIDFKAAAGESKAAMEEVFGRLVERAQTAGCIRADVTPHEVLGLIVGTCAMADPGGGEACPSRMLDIVCDGLRTEGGSRDQGPHHL